jgi:tripartite ATP-independent transporter DctM subunit
MEWYEVLFLFVGSLICVMFTGLPIAFTFMLVSGTTMFLMFGEAGVRQLVLGVQSQLSNFTFTAIPFFVVMGEVFFQSGILTQTMNTLSKLVRRVPGRLSSVTLMGGGIFAALSGSSLANVVMFGSLMMPEMKRRGYCMKLTTGTIMASGSLSMIIPPSNLAILLGGIAGISAGNILLGAIGPGIIMLSLFLIYVIGICYLNPFAHACFPGRRCG